MVGDGKIIGRVGEIEGRIDLMRIGGDNERGRISGIKGEERKR